MNSIKFTRMKELESFFGKRWDLQPFKGSKAQRKNALKEYNKLVEEWDAELAAKREAKIAGLRQTIQDCKWSLEYDFSKPFWWEVLPMDSYDRCVQRLHKAEEELKAILG